MCASREREFVCTLCPNGCDLLVVEKADGSVSVEGARCGKGVEYGTKEAVDPERILTTTMRVAGSDYAVIPVRSNAPMKKSELRETVAMLATREVEPPVAYGQVLVENVGRNHVGIVATGSCQGAPSASHRRQ